MAASMRLRAKVWLHQLELDRELASGADEHGSAELAARADQLRSVHFRRHLVANLDAALAKAAHPPHWHSGALPVCSREIMDARTALEALRETLIGAQAPSVCGLAQASCLIDDPEGPLYHRRADGTSLSELARRAALCCTEPAL
jgi:hypothetical protein